MSEWKLDSIRITPEGKLTEFHVPKHPLPERPRWVQCDFCDQKTEHATFRHSYSFTFLLQTRGPYKSMTYDPGLAICPQCKPLVQSHDFRSTAARQLLLGGDYDPDPAVLRSVEAFHRCLMLSFSGDAPIEWESEHVLPPVPEHLFCRERSRR